jgi:serine phosphatase RsbU (regulator of sigma subunit)/HAMP domain-containing protein
MSIRLRIALLSAMGLAIAAGITSIVLARDMRRQEEQLVSRIVLGAGQHMGRLVEPQLEHHDLAALNRMAQMELGAVVDSVDIIDDHGVDLADTAHDSYRSDREAVFEGMKTHKPIVEVTGRSASGVIPVIGPDNEVIGVIVLHMNTSKEQHRLASARVKAAAIVATGTAIGLGLAYLLSAFLVMPLRCLARGMRRVAAGEGNGRVEPPSAPEFRNVFENFNDMSLAVAKRARNLELLNGMAAEVAMATQLNEIAESVRRTGAEMLQGESRLWIFDSHGEKLESVPAPGRLERVVAGRSCPVNRAARESQLLLIGEREADLPPGSSLALSMPPVQAAVMVPLQTLEGVVGTLSVEGVPGERVVTHEQVSIATTIANIVGPAVAAHLRAQSQARSARMLQSILVPELPAVIPGVEIAVRYHPAEEMGRVGGDYYDFIRFSDSEWGFVIGDVSGKGLLAAQHAATARYAMRAYLLEYRAADLAMTLTNSALYAQFEGENFITIFCGILNVTDRKLRYVRAGHPLPIIHSKESGAIRHLAAPGVATGITSKADYHEAVEVLSPGDTIVIFTDGLTEAKSGSEVYGEQRLDEAIVRYGQLPARNIADNIIREVTLFSGGRLTDDAALIVLRIL